MVRCAVGVQGGSAPPTPTPPRGYAHRRRIQCRQTPAILHHTLVPEPVPLPHRTGRMSSRARVFRVPRPFLRDCASRLLTQLYASQKARGCASQSRRGRTVRVGCAAHRSVGCAAPPMRPTPEATRAALVALMMLILGTPVSCTLADAQFAALRALSPPLCSPTPPFQTLPHPLRIMRA